MKFKTFLLLLIFSLLYANNTFAVKTCYEKPVLPYSDIVTETNSLNNIIYTPIDKDKTSDKIMFFTYLLFALGIACLVIMPFFWIFAFFIAIPILIAITVIGSLILLNSKKTKEHQNYNKIKKKLNLSIFFGVLCLIPWSLMAILVLLMTIGW